MNIYLNSQQEFCGIKDYKIDAVYSPLERVGLTTPQVAGGDAVMSSVSSEIQRKKAKSFANSADRKNSNNSNMSTDFMSSVHSNSGTKQKEGKQSSY